jgi:hypothetical protein
MTGGISSKAQMGPDHGAQQGTWELEGTYTSTLVGNTGPGNLNTNV